MTDTITSQNIDLSSWDTLYICVVPTACLKLRGTCPKNVSSVEAYKSLRWPSVHGHVVYACDVSSVDAWQRPA
jgi:hypothetical protein